MTWAYCPKCGRGLDQPTLSLALTGRRICECGHRIDLSGHDASEAARNLEDRIETMEAYLRGARILPPLET